MSRRKEASGLGHLNGTELARLQTLAAGVRLVTIASEARADEFAAGLHAEMAERPFTLLDADGNSEISAEEMAVPAQMMARMRLMHVNDAPADAE